jgi:two-component system chemotaxis response regulator CheY
MWRPVDKDEVEVEEASGGQGSALDLPGGMMPPGPPRLSPLRGEKQVFHCDVSPLIGQPSHTLCADTGDRGDSPPGWVWGSAPETPPPLQSHDFPQNTLTQQLAVIRFSRDEGQPLLTFDPRSTMLRALIIDDDPVNTRFLMEILSPYAGCDTADNGRAGLEAFGRALVAGQPYDLIFLDVMMPGMDGHQALEGMRHLERLQGVASSNAAKVIMVSAHDDPRTIYRAFFQGQALSFLAKPFSCETVLDELRKFDIIDERRQESPRNSI